MSHTWHRLVVISAVTCTFACNTDAATQKAGGDVAVEEVATLKVTGLPNDASITILAFSPDGALLASASDEDTASKATVLVWHVAKRSLQATLVHGRGPIIKSVAFSPDGKKLATAGMDGLVKIWEVGSWKELARLEFQGGLLFAVAFDPKGRSLAMGGAAKSLSPKGEVKLCDVATAKISKSFTLDAGPVRCLDFSPDGKLLAFGTGAGHGLFPADKLELINVSTGKVEQSVPHRAGVLSVRYSPDGKTLAAGCGNAEAKLWDATTLKARLTLKGHRAGIASVAYSMDGTLLAGADEDRIMLWSVPSGSELMEASKQVKGSFSVAFSPKDQILATGGEDQEIKLWRVRLKNPN